MTAIKTLFLILLLLTFATKAKAKNNETSLLIDKAVKKLYQNPDESISYSQSLSLNIKK